MVLSVSTAARRQVRFALWRKRMERLGKWQAENGQQRDGDELTQRFYSNTDPTHKAIADPLTLILRLRGIPKMDSGIKRPIMGL
jgi:hypothetical protein